jgi:hypothetical protein
LAEFYLSEDSDYKMIPLALFRKEGDIEDECSTSENCSKYLAISPSRETYLRDSDMVLVIGKKDQKKTQPKNKKSNPHDKKKLETGLIKRKTRSASPQKNQKSKDHIIDLDS